MLFVGGPLHGQVREWTGEPMNVQGPVDLSVLPQSDPMSNDVTLRATSKTALYVANTLIVGNGVMLTAMVVSHITPPVESKVVDALCIAAGLGEGRWLVLSGSTCR